jgi:predicted phosphoribosyltransferase
MNMIFSARREAGFMLGRKLRSLKLGRDPLVLALPRGGVPVAFEIALELDAPLDVFTVRKLGVPGHEELAMGAIATGGIRVLNAEVVEGLKISPDVIDAVAEREEIELHRREQSYRQDSAAPDVTNRFVILVDDGIATGSTMLAAIQAVQNGGAAHVLVATPLAPRSTVAKLRKAADQVVVLSTPEPFHGVGQWYQDFAQTTDDEVREFLRIANERRLEHAWN